MPCISIIVPIYNVAPYLDKCICSILEQTYRKLEIILVDDGSTDSSGDICDMYARKDERIHVIHKENGGLVSARKAGILVSTGEYVGYVDGDDWIEPDMYETMLQLMLQYEADMVTTNYFKESDNSCIISKDRIPCGCYDKRQLIPQMLCDKDFNECNLSPYIWSKLFRKELLQNIQLDVDNDINFGEDVAVSYPYILKCEKIVIDEYSGYHYMQRTDSIVNSRKCDELYCNMMLISYLEKVFGNTGYSKVLLPALNQYTKTLMLLRDISYFDDRDAKLILSPFGGIGKTDKIIIYGAGKMGQNIYRYLNTFQGIDILAWLDKEACTYQKWGMPIQEPERIKDYSDIGYKVIIAINNRKTATAVKKYLLSQGVEEKRIHWLLEAFVQDRRNVFEMCAHKKIAICGFRKNGKKLYETLVKNGYYVPYIIEPNYQALNGLQSLEKEAGAELLIVGFDKGEKFYKKAEVILVSDDMDFRFVRETMKIAGISVQILPQNKEKIVCSRIAKQT